MDSRGRKRAEAAEQLPADKRACSSSEFRAGPSSSPSPSVQPPASSSTNAVMDCDMESSSGRSERDSASVDGSCNSEDGGVDDDEEPDQGYDHREFRDHHFEPSKGKITKLLSGLEDDASPGAQLAALTELSETLSFCMEDSLTYFSMDTLVPLLVKLAGHENNPDIMLLSIRSLTYICDVMPRLSGVLVKHGAVPVLCARLMAIEYLDVAEQCLQALDKISRDQPVPCLQAGMIMAALTYVDFFSTSVQRVALSTVANVCKKLPSDCSSHVMEAIPTLCNLLQYEDRKLVETTATCLIRITESFSGSSEMLDELCKHGVVHQSSNLIRSDSHMTLGQTTYTGLIGLLTRFASGSVVAVRTLFELNISSTLRDILTTCGISHGTAYSLVGHGHSNQVHEVLKLLNQLLPPVASEDKNIQLTLAKEKILVDQPKLLHQFASDILPVSIQVVSSGANLYVCYGCVSIIKNIVYFSTSDMLLDLLENNNISSFLAGILTRKDHHVLISALKTAEILLQRHPDVFLSSFIKEGVVYAIDALLMPENAAESIACQSSHMHPSTGSNCQDVKRCLCYAFDASLSFSSSDTVCRLGKDTVLILAKCIKATYFATSPDSEMGLTKVLQKLKTFSAVLNDVDKLSKNDYSAENEECLSPVLDQIMMELIGGEPMSTFEFIESGIVRSLAFYLSNGMNLQGQVDNQSLANHFHVVMKRFQTFASISLSTSGHHWEGMPLTLLTRKLQSALSSFDSFPVVSSLAYKPRNVYANIPVGRSTLLPCLKVRFMVEEGERVMNDYANVLTVEPSSSLDAIEGFLWPKVSTNRTEHPAESAGKDIKETDEDLNVAQLKDNEEPRDNNAKIMGELQNLSSSLLEGIANQEPHLLPEADGTLKAREPMTGNTSSLASTDEEHDEGRKCSTSHNNEDALPKLFFYFEGKQIDRSLTLYQAILQQQVNAQPDMIVGPKFWNEVYKVTFKRAERKICDSEVSSSIFQSLNVWGKAGLSWPKLSFFSSVLSAAELPCKLEKSNPSYDILLMLKILEGLNRFSFHLMSYEKSKAFAEGRIVDFDDLKVISTTIPQTEFLSNKLTEKLEQQMRDPLSLSTGSMPSWCSQLMAACPFLFSFEARWKYLRLTAFNSSRIEENPTPQLNSNIENSSNGQRSHTGSSSRQRFRVDRSHILESAANMMALHASSKAVLEVEYVEEVGTGVGPTLEFYTVASQEFQKFGLGMWRGDDRSSISLLHPGTSTLVGDSKYIVAPLGLFPRPWSAATSSSNEIQFSEVINKFVLLGQLVAKALQDGRVLDLPFSRAFYKLILEQELDIYDIQSFDPELGRTLLEFQALVNRKRYLESTMVKNTEAASDLHFRGTKVEDLCLDFTLPGYSDYVLPSGRNSKMVTLVDIDDLEEYVSLTVDATVRSGISRQLVAFKSGFNQVFPLKALHIFTEDELERLLCGERDTWDFGELLDHIKFDHGYTPSSPPIISLLETIQEFECNQRRAFLQFVTGAPRLPPGGLAALNPKLTIVRKHCSDFADMDLPSVMTCANYLKLPPYSSKERTRERLLYAITEGQGSFHLS